MAAAACRLASLMATDMLSFAFRTLPDNERAAKMNLPKYFLLMLGVQLLAASVARADENDDLDLLVNGQRADVKKDYDTAIKNYTKYIQLKPDEARPHFMRAFAYSHKGDIDNAISGLTDVIRVAPNDHSLADASRTVLVMNAYGLRGVFYLNKREYDKAISDLTEATRLDPKGAENFSNRASAYEAKGDREKALADYNESIRLNPNRAITYCQRGGLYEIMEEVDKSLADYTKAVQESPSLAWGYVGRGRIYEKKGDHEKAISDYSKGIELDPKDPHTPNDLAWIRATCPDAKFRDGKEAIRLALKAIELKPRPAAFDTLAAAYAEAGEYDKAVATAEKALTMATKADEKRDLQSRLDLFKSGKPFREKSKE
jgi:tetratricopeptide (TPR) repeat protein